MLRILRNSCKTPSMVSNPVKRLAKMTAVSAMAMKIYTWSCPSGFQTEARMLSEAPSTSRYSIRQARNSIMNFYSSGEEKIQATGILLKGGHVLIPVTSTAVADSLKKRAMTMRRGVDYDKGYKPKVEIGYEVVEDLTKEGFLVARLTKVNYPWNFILTGF